MIGAERRALLVGAATAMAGAIASGGLDVAAADPARPDPIGALGAASELALTGGPPRQRFGAHASYFVTHRAGLHLALGGLTADGDAGHATLGLAYRAAVARPRLELDVHADAGLAWPRAGAVGAGVHTYLWPLRRVPIAVDAGLTTYALLDGLDSRVAISATIGLALAR